MAIIVHNPPSSPASNRAQLSEVSKASTDVVPTISTGFLSFNGGDNSLGEHLFRDSRKLPYSSHWMFSSPFGQPRGLNVYEVRQFEKSGWVQMAQRAIKNQVRSIEWDLVNKDDEDQQDYQAQKDVVFRFLECMNHNGEDLTDTTIPMLGDVLSLDAGAWVKIYSLDSYEDREVDVVDHSGRSHGTKTVKLLKPFGERRLEQVMYADGATFTIEYDRYRRLRAFYQYSYRNPTGVPIAFEPDEIHYFVLNPQTSDAYGFSPLQSVEQVVELLIQSTRWNKDFFKNNAIPDGILSFTGMDDKETERLQHDWNRKVKGKPHKLLFINKEVAFNQLVSSSRDMEWLDGQKWFMHLVFGSYHVSPVEAGFHENVNQGNQAGQERVTVKNAVKPYLQLIEKALNNDIIPELLQTEAHFVPFKFKFFPHDHVQEQIEFEQKTKELEMGALTINEYRSAKGLPPVTWGDEPMRGQAQTMVNIGSPSDGRPRDRESRDVNESSVSLSGVYQTSKQLSSDTDVVDESSSYEAFYKRMISQWEKTVISSLERNSFDIKTASFGDFVADLYNTINTRGFRQALRRIVKDTMLQGVEDAEKELNVQVGVQAHFEAQLDKVIDEQLEGYSVSDGRFVGIKGASKELQNKIINQIDKDLQLKTSKSDMVRHVQELFDVERSRAEKIVRTETTRILNVGKLSAYRDSGLPVRKAYSAVMDGKTSDLCRRLHNKYFEQGVPAEEEFVDDVSGQRFMIPPAHVNCRCVIEARLPDNE